MANKINPASEEARNLKQFAEFFHLSEQQLENARMETILENGQYSTFFNVTLRDSRDPCPYCHEPGPKVHGYSEKRVNYNLINGRTSQVILRVRRYKCPKCGRTYTQYNPLSYKQSRISNETVVNVLDELKKPEATFTSVGRRYDLSVTTVVSLFDTHVRMKRQTLSEYMSIDENYCITNGRSKFACVLLDFKSQDAIDVLPNRFKTDLIHYFKSIPWEEREKVKAIATDMYPTYRDTIAECFPPTTKCVIDHFHLIKEFNTQVDKVRKAAMREYSSQKNKLKYRIDRLKEMPDIQSQARQEELRKLQAAYDKASDAYYLLKKFNFLLGKRPDLPMFDPTAERHYNSHFDRHMNYWDLREALFKLEPSLKECIRLRRLLTNLYEDNCSSEEGEADFEYLYQELMKSKVREMKHFGGTINRWKVEILNSLDTVEQVHEIQKDGSVRIRNRRLSNGIIERKNKIIKNVKNVANGYTNFERFRTRLLYVLRSDARYSALPVYPSRARRKVKEDEY